MGQIKQRIDYILKHNLIIQRLYKLIMSYIFKFLGLFVKIDDKLILFNGHGWKYNDSPRAIYEYIIDSNDYNEFNFVWALDEPQKYDIPNATKIKIDTLNYFIIALKAKYWVSCVNIERGLNFKKKETIYLNTWHGVPLKLVGNSVSNRKDFDFSHIDLFCYSGKYEKDIYKRDFKVQEENMLFTGLPRNDELYNLSEQTVLEYKKRLEIPENKKVILYAPTWRDSVDRGKNYAIEPPIDINFFQKELGDEYVLLLRTHTYTNNILGIEFNEFVRDLSTYPEVNDLLIIADILISDYSAVMFDYSILEKPIICFAYDYKQYTLERGFYIDIDKELPNGIVKNQEDLINKIKDMNYGQECKKTALFKKKFIERGGNATEECVKYLLDNKKYD